MAKVFELNLENWKQWVSERPPSVQKLCEQFPPDRLYLLNPTGQRVTILSYSENDTLTVLVSGEYNLVMFEREVFGISPKDLQECDLPSEHTPKGAFLTEEADIDKFIAAMRNKIAN
jgi:hypothetical protein